MIMYFFLMLDDVVVLTDHLECKFLVNHIDLGTRVDECCPNNTLNFTFYLK